MRVDEAGRPTTTLGPRLTDTGVVSTTTVYDANGNPVEFTDENGYTSQQGFDVMNRLITQTDPAGATTSYGYDVLGRMVSMQAPGKPAATLDYTWGDQAASPPVPATQMVTRPDGVTATASLDADGLVTSTVFSDATPTITHTWDNLGRLVASVGAVSTTRAYDTLGQTLSVTRAGSTVGYGWDRPGRVGSITYPNDETIERGYDGSSELGGAW